jgi:hypothetical protein
MSQKVTKAVAGVLALGAIAFGASAIAGASGNDSSSAPASQAGGPPGAAGARGHGFPGGPGRGTPVAGAAASKARAAALAKYPGTVQVVMGAPDGSYVVHVIKSDGSEVHVAVSSQFKVTGTLRGFRPGGPPPQAPSSGSGSNGSTT